MKKQWIALKRGAYLSAYLFRTQVWWLELQQPSGSRREKPGAEAARIKGQESGFFTTVLPSDQPWTGCLLRALLFWVFWLLVLDWTLTNTLGNGVDEELMLAVRAEELCQFSWQRVLTRLTPLSICSLLTETAFKHLPVLSGLVYRDSVNTVFRSPLGCAWTAAWVYHFERKPRRGRHRLTQLYSPHGAQAATCVWWNADHRRTPASTVILMELWEGGSGQHVTTQRSSTFSLLLSTPTNKWFLHLPGMQALHPLQGPLPRLWMDWQLTLKFSPGPWHYPARWNIH